MRTGNKSANQQIVTCPDKATGTDVRQLRLNIDVQIVNLQQSDTRPAAVAGQESGVPCTALARWLGRQSSYDGGFQVFARRNARGSDLSRLSILPVVIHCQ